MNAAPGNVSESHQRTEEAFRALEEELERRVAEQTAELRAANEELKRSAEARLAQVHFLESLERIDGAIRRADDVEQMLRDVVETVLSILECDRAWLLYPCDPEAPSFRVLMECTRPEYPGALALDLEVPMAPGQAQDMRDALGSEDPMTYTLGTEHPVCRETAERFRVQAQMFTAVYPKVGTPWLFGVHQCSYARVWTQEDRQLFREIGRRIADGLSSMLFLRELEKSEARFRSLVETAASAILCLSPDHRILELNPEAERLYGCARADALEKDYLQLFVPEEVRDAVAEDIRKVLAGEPARGFENPVIRRDGDRRILSWSMNRLTDQRGQPTAVIAVGQDVTENKRAQAQAQTHIYFLESLEQVDNAIRRTDDVEQMLREVLKAVFSIFDGDRVWLLYPCDPQAPTFHVPVEISRSEYPGAFALNLEIPMRPGGDEVCTAALASEGPVAYVSDRELPIHHELTEKFGVRSQLVMAIYPKIGRPWMLGMHQCSHPRSWTQEEQRLFHEIARRLGDALSTLLILRDLRESEERFRTLVEQAADAFFLNRPDGKILDVNQRACDSLGYSRDELLSLSLAEIEGAGGSPSYRLGLWETLAPGEPMTWEGAHRRKDGTTFPVEVRVGLLELDGERLMLGLARDVTGRKRAEEELAEYREHLEVLVEERTRQLEAAQGELLRKERLAVLGQLTASVAHEIRNPLGTIRSSMFVIDRTLRGKDLGIKEDLERARRNVIRCDTIIEELLDYVRDKTLNLTPTALDDYIGRVLDEQAIPDGIELLRRLASKSSIPLDPERFRRCVINVVTNACHAMTSERGSGGQLTVETARSADRVEIRIADTGVGISADDLARVFEPLYSTKSFGVGLGLPIVKQVMEQHDGGVEIASRPGEGTAVTLWLPADGAEET
ncbi:MAG: PAS domain S-box protein [bacterium]|nr:PAS domain S-box protein [bacterium]